MAKHTDKWQGIKLGTICDKIGSGATPRGGSKVYIRDGVALVRSQNVFNSGFNKQGLVFIDDDHAKKLANVTIEPDDVLLNITGDSVARSCQVDNSVLPARVNQHVSIIRPNLSQLSSRFLRYLLVAPGMQQYLLNLASSGATRNALTKQMIEDIELSLPELPEQQAIAGVLFSLDDKIELLRKQNKTLEAIAQAIFKEWFVNFNFPDKNGKPYRDNGGKMVDSELGEIPEGWRVDLYEDIAKVSTGKGLKKEFISVEGKYLVLGANGILGRTDEYLFDDDLILTGRVGTLGTVHISHNKVWISDNVLISKANHKELFYFAYFTLKRFNFESLNRGSTQPLITQTDIKNVNVVIPNKDILRQYSITSDHIFGKVRNNYDQIKTLTKLRDTLLPKLMSGQVRVKNLMFKGAIKDNWDKIELYIISLWLLFFLMIIITIDIPLYIGSNWQFIGFQKLLRTNVIPSIALFFLVLGLLFYFLFKYKLGGSKEIPFEITRIENINFEHLTFLTTYIIPLICFDLSNTKYVVALFVLLICIGIIYVKTDMFYANPSLALLGYHIYKVDGKFRNGNKEKIILIAREKLKCHDKVHYRKLDERIYYVKVDYDEK